MFQRQHLIVIELFVEGEKNLRQVRFDKDENIQHHHSHEMPNSNSIIIGAWRALRQFEKNNTKVKLKPTAQILTCSPSSSLAYLSWNSN
jgi:hypothetical protein